MDEREKEQLKEMYARYNYRCFVCGKAAVERAHIIGQGKTKRAMYGDETIDNPLNWLPVCCKHHNDLVDIGNSPGNIGMMLLLIDTDDRVGIERLVRLNIERKREKVGSYSMC